MWSREIFFGSGGRKVVVVERIFFGLLWLGEILFGSGESFVVERNFLRVRWKVVVVERNFFGPGESTALITTFLDE